MRELRFTGRFKLVSPLRLSAGVEAELADSAVRRRADGAPVVPGSSVAGAFRSYLERLTGVDCKLARGLPTRARAGEPACACPLCGLFGDVRPGLDSRARASRLTFCDSLVENASVRIADGVAIARGRGAAAERKKFDQEEVAPGAEVLVEVRGEGLGEEELDWVGSCYRALGSGHLTLGGRGAQGSGRMTAEELSLRWRDPTLSEHLIALVMHDGRQDVVWPERIEPFPGRESLSNWEVKLLIALRPDSTFLVADPAEAIATGYDRAPRGGAGAPELPASSLRGALRSASERVLRSLKTTSACDPTDPSSSCAACARSGEPRERCLSCRLFGNEDWASWLRIVVNPGPGASQAQPLDHVAIDRFTGGAAEGLKFDTLSVTGACFEVILSADKLAAEDRLWVTGLLALTLNDLQQGRWQLGHGGARGHGWFRLAIPPTFPEPLPEAIRGLWAKLGIAFPEGEP